MTSFPPQQARRPGRPRKLSPEDDARPLLSCEAVVEAAYQLCDSVRLDNLTLNDVADALGVSTTTVRHHVKTRRRLTKLLVDRYFREMREQLPPLVGDWMVDLDNYLTAQGAINARKPSFPNFLFEHRFGPEIEPFGTDDAALVSRRLLHVLRSAGLGPEDAALAWHMVMHLTLSIGYAVAHGQTPTDQTAVFERIGGAFADDSADRAVIAAMGRVDLPMIYSNMTAMVTHAISVAFAFPEGEADRNDAGRAIRVAHGRT